VSHPKKPALSTLLAALAVGVGAPAGATTAISLASPGTLFDSSPYSLGFAFSVTADVNLVGLGAYDHLGDGLEAPAEVALWTGTSTVATLSAVVPSGTAAALEGAFRFAPVAPLRLHAGEVYVVAAYVDGSTATSFGLGQGGAASVDSRVTLLGDRFGVSFFHLVYPDQVDVGAGAWLGANVQLAAVPEPDVATMLGLGLAALAWRRRSVFSRISRVAA
jgi:hypothetical protein